jgi:hypothetical protein
MALGKDELEKWPLFYLLTHPRLDLPRSALPLNNRSISYLGFRLVMLART